MTEYYQHLNDALKPNNSEGILEEWEVEAIIISFVGKRGEDGASEEEIFQVIKWCEEMRIGAELVNLVCKGIVDINLKDGEPVFSATPEGLEALKQEEEKNNGAFN
jgi:hypothetical protein